jgi:hypothetical protein
MVRAVVACVIAVLVWARVLSRPRRVVSRLVVVSPVTTVEPVVRRIIKTADRCDWPKCDAAAYHRIIFADGTLDACNHHLEEAPESLMAKALYHIDEAWAI